MMLDEIMVLPRQLSYSIKTQLKAPTAPYFGLWNKISSTRGISGLSLVLLLELLAQIIERTRAAKSASIINQETFSISDYKGLIDFVD